MAGYKTSQFFKIKSTTNLKVPVPPLGELSVFCEFNGKKMEPLGEFPRRITIGETLFKDDTVRVLSPANGIIRYIPSQSLLKILIDGQLNFQSQPGHNELPREDFFNKLDSLGLLSLDFPAQPLYDLFQRLIPDRDSFIVFAPFTRENLIDYKTKIFDSFAQELALLKKNIAALFPNVSIIDFLTPKKTEYQYPDGTPGYFLYKYCGVEVTRDFPKDRFLYLGPETIFHMIRAIYQGIPFHERYVSVNIINQSGVLEGETQAFLLRNGINLSDFLNTFETSYSHFTVNSFYSRQPVYEIGTEFIFDINRHHSIIICDKIYYEKEERICTDCNACSFYCPVDAKPRALLNKNKKGFDTSACLECGICSFLCPAHIDFSSRITEVKQGTNIVIS